MFTLPAVSSEVLWGVSLALMSMMIYGACMVLVSAGVRGLGSGPGSMVAAAAGLPAGLVLALVQLAGGVTVETPGAWALCSFALAGICSTYLGRWLVFKSIELIGPSSASGLQSTSPLITAVFGWVFLGELIGPIGFAGIALGIAGLVAMSVGISRSQSRAAAERVASQRGFVSAFVLIGVASAMAYSASHVFRAFAVRQWNEPLLGAAVGSAAGLLVLILASAKRLPGYLREVRANPVGARVYVAVGVMQFVAQAMVIASMKYIPASVAALLSMSTPLIVMPLGRFALRSRERLSGVTVLGICITLVGIALVVLYGGGRV